MRLLVGIPALNEARTIADVIQAVPRNIPGCDAVSIVVVDDGSRDETAAKARASGAMVIRHGWNRGLGIAFQTIVRYALEQGTDILVTIDGDGQFSPEDIPTLIAPILNGECEVCTASRFSNPTLIPAMPFIKRWGNQRVAALVSALTRKRFYDVSCGFRAYSREALLRLTVYHSFTYTHETILDLAAKDIPISEVPLSIRGVREFGKSKIAASIPRYCWQTSLIILRFYRDHRPLRLCFYLSLPLTTGGIVLFTVSLMQFLKTNAWLKWAAFLAGGLFGLALAIVFFGFLADMGIRLRKNQEETLYYLRRGVNNSFSNRQAGDVPYCSCDFAPTEHEPPERMSVEDDKQGSASGDQSRV
jgi:glycosyltransferase involved in cell wall biosynthesis